MSGVVVPVEVLENIRNELEGRYITGKLPVEYVVLLSEINEGRKGKISYGGRYIISAEKMNLIQAKKNWNKRCVTQIFGWGRKSLVKWSNTLRVEITDGWEREIPPFPYIISGGLMWVLVENDE